MNMMCRFQTEYLGDQYLFEEIRENLQELEEDGLVEIMGRRITLTEEGIPFVRNVCMAFDRKLHQSKPEKKLFSQTV